jgi:chromosome segregation ATPase
MKIMNESESVIEDITEAPTGEYPALKQGGTPPDHLNGKEHFVIDSERAAFWLTHLESEVNRLHEKWHSIDAEFKTREAHIAELRDEVKDRDAAIAKLTADLSSGAKALKAAEERIASGEANIARLNTEAKVRDGKVDELAAALGGADDRHGALQKTLDSTLVEVARLNASVRQEQETAAGIAKHNEELLADQRRLQIKLQDLEIYINGRYQSWSELNAQLAGYKDDLAGMERTVKVRDASVARADHEKRGLAARINDLERQCEELIGRRNEREAAYDELQQKLAELLETTGQLKAAHSAKVKETEQAWAKAASSQQSIESLERAIAGREETLAALRADLEQHKSAVSDLTGVKETLAKRVGDLEQTVDERTLQAQGLREELRASHDEVEAMRARLIEQNTRLVESTAAAEEKDNLAERLARDLRSLEHQVMSLRNDLARLEERSTELGVSRSDAVAECARLKSELAARQELVTNLEMQLRAKQATTDLLERNVGRITDLGASLAALDRQMVEDQRGRADHLHSPDFAETIASGSTSGPSESVPSLEELLGNPDEILDVGEPLRKAAPRKLVVMVGGRDVDYPLLKREMTIGRGHSSDIRIASHFISRVHAKVSTNGIATVIEDVGSKNGVLVNSERVVRCVLRDGDIVSLGGELNLRFVDAAP